MKIPRGALGNSRTDFLLQLHRTEAEKIGARSLTKEVLWRVNPLAQKWLQWIREGWICGIRWAGSSAVWCGLN